MSRDQWNDVDGYLAALLSPDDAALANALETTRAANIPSISVSAPQGKFLHLLARLVSARRILEIGTLGGYSTIWLARALPSDGMLTTLEIDPAHAAVARASLITAGLAHLVDVRVGAALDSLPRLEAEDNGPYDLVFIDADKQNNARYVRAALTLTRRGSVIVVDNVVREGTVADAESTDATVRGAREVLQLIADDPRLDGTALQTVGSKGWDGFALALVTR